MPRLFSLPTLSLLLAGTCAGCSPSPHAPKAYAFTLLSESDPGEPLAGVQLVRAGKSVAATDTTGFAEFSLVGEEGERVTLGADCPPGTTAFEKEVTTTLRAYDGGSIPELHLRCIPNERELTVVAIFENGPFLPIQHRLKTLAVTDKDGVAHFELHGKPSETFELVINTEQQPGLRPASPGASLTIGAHDDAQVLQRSFILPKAKARPKARGPVMPKRIQ